MRSLVYLNRLFIADGSEIGPAIPLKGISKQGHDGRLPWSIALHCKPKDSAPTGTIAFDGKVQMAPSADGPWEDVTGGALTTIAVGTEASDVVQLAATVALKPYIRGVIQAAITGTPVYNEGSIFTFDVFTT